MQGRGSKDVTILFKIVAFILFSFYVLSQSVYAGDISLTPAKLMIDMPEGYKKEPISVNITVKNNLAYDIDVKTKVSNPPEFELTKNYTFIPDLSWVKTTPTMFTIPAKGETVFKVTVDIPDSEKQHCYNKSWEVWISVSKIKGGFINVEPVTRLLIHTPPNPPSVTEGILKSLPLLVFLLTVFISIIAAKVFIERRKKISIYEKNRYRDFQKPSYTMEKKSVLYEEDIDKKIDQLLSRYDTRN